MTLLTIDDVEQYLETLLDTFPPALFEELNGGVTLEEATRDDPEFPAGEVYIMGEYIVDYLGNSIVLYYGSMVEIAKKEQWDLADWQKELKDTFSHELTHHMEWRSGTKALDVKDALELEAMRQAFQEEQV
ncbi:metallopeptidase family protein [Bengtsoniella intestinalis]|uniref:metallopeptidase family protein n=1 Tax=Bengtsoniella intestinalis TaxID=3073143 RepID=UPI00391FC8D6